MLGPEDRRLLLDALRPPAGFELDQAVGTTYSLDLTSLLAAPLGFALFDRESSDGQLIADPIALIQAVRSYADRITVFCQAGQIAIPREYRAILTYLEGAVCEVVPPVRDAIFHPKVWLMRYSRPGDGARSFRLLSLSRNLTFDRAWDTVLRLDGEVQEGSNAGEGIARFVARLPDLAVRPLSPQRRQATLALADEVRSVVFEAPAGFDRLAFWPLGLGEDGNPFSGGRIDRLLVISPFLTAGMAETLGRRGSRNILVSRPEAFDAVGATALARYAETLTLNPTAYGALSESEEDAEGEEVAEAPTDEAIAERPDIELRGLHAKLYVADAPYRGRVWTGSANATNAAFGGNVEFLVELEGRKADCGVDAFIGDNKDGIGLRKLLEPYRPANDAPKPPTEKEDLERRLDLARRRLAGRGYTVRIAPAEAETFSMRVEITEGTGEQGRDWWPATVEDVTVRLRPLTLGAAYATQLDLKDGAVAADFGSVTFERLTSFCVVDLEVAGEHERVEATFVVNAQLVGAPEDRRQRTLVTLLENRKDLIRFLLLLLGQIGADDLGNAVDMVTGEPTVGQGTWLFAEWQALLEPMVRALAAEPTRLDEIDRLIKELDGTDAGRTILPPGWREVWEPIWKAREGLRSAEGSRR